MKRQLKSQKFISPVHASIVDSYNLLEKYMLALQNNMILGAWNLAEENLKIIELRSQRLQEKISDHVDYLNSQN